MQMNKQVNYQELLFQEGGEKKKVNCLIFPGVMFWPDKQFIFPGMSH